LTFDLSTVDLSTVDLSTVDLSTVDLSNRRPSGMDMDKNVTYLGFSG
jgi:uncharacterized protein YjbI with pentapeptide repeats